MKISLRDVHTSDLPLLLSWRNNPLVNAGFYLQSKGHLIQWNEHTRWFAARNRDWRTFLILYDDDTAERPVGVTTIGQLDHWSPEIGVYVGEVTLWGMGVGKEAVRLAMEYIKSQGKEDCHTTIFEKNERSLRLFYSLGFKYLGKARRGEVWLQKKL